MVALHVSFNPTTKVAHVDETTTVPAGFTNIGTFEHPDATYPDSYVIFHGVRELLYFVKPGSPVTLGAKFPDNITDMSAVTIQFTYPDPLRLTTNLDTVKTAVAGTDVTFTVAAADGRAPYTYEWFYRSQYNSVWIKIDPTVNPTAATASLKNSAVTAQSTGQYKAVVKDAFHNEVESYSTMLSVSDAPVTTSITATPSTLALSVAADAANGKTVAFASVPAGSTLKTLSIKTAPAAGRATATIANNVLTVKPVAAGAATTVVVTDGTHDVTLNVTVAA